MNRFDSMFSRLEGERRGAFVPFVVLGHPDLEASGRALDLLARSGADAIEVGLPFSDPIADGPTIQRATTRALAKGATPSRCFEVVARFRSSHPDVPLGLLTYANLVVRPGVDAFYAAAGRAGIDAVLVADVPHREARPFAEAAKSAGVAPVLLAPADAPAAALEAIATLGEAFTYVLARRGVTGVRSELHLDHARTFDALAKLGAPPPLMGFGISEPSHVRAALTAGARGVIVGSKCVAILDREADEETRLAELGRYVASMKAET
ncbi:MAG: tryptophan synthase subunit alpha [Polyangiaceae bacterium]|nr:tryptophan synthase subunit alpha [Polyangiaceae bacterium]